jgi:hypothetical protein
VNPPPPKKKGGLLLTGMVGLVLLASFFAISYPGWRRVMGPFRAYDRIEVGMGEADAQVGLTKQSEEPRPRKAEGDWAKHGEAAWKVTYSTGGTPSTIVVWYDAKRRVLAKEMVP